MNYSTERAVQDEFNSLAADIVKNMGGSLLKILMENGFEGGEKLCQDTGNILAQQMMSIALTAAGKEIDKNVSKIDYKKSSVEKREILTIFGPVAFKRYRYRRLKSKKNKGGYYPLDEKVGIIPKSRLSPAVTKLTAQTSSNISYGEAVKSIETMTGFKISKMGAQKCVLNTGKLLQEENDKIKKDFWKYEQVGEIESENLYVESDAVYIAKQDSKRIKGGKPARKTFRQKIIEARANGAAGVKPEKPQNQRTTRKKIKVNMTKAYNGKTTIKNETTCDNVIVCGKTGNIVSFRKAAAAVVGSRFETTKVKNCWHSTDGEVAYKQMTQIIHPQAIHVLDSHHIHRKITEKCKDKKLDIKIRSMIFVDNDVQKACEMIAVCRDSKDTSEQNRKKLSQLHEYLSNNIESIDINNQKLGTMESTNGHVIGSRMKNFGGGWSIKGADAMISIRTSIASGIELPLMKRLC